MNGLWRIGDSGNCPVYLLTFTVASVAVKSSATFDSFGNASGNLATRYKFTGREYDDFTGLHYYRARWYDGNLGRFISEDPIGFAGGDVNLYGYVGNGPLGAKDPLGLEASFWNEIADSADQSIEYATAYYQPDPHAINSNTAVIFVSYIAHGTVDLLRVGNGIAEAYYCEETWEGRAAYVLMDVARAAGIASIVLGATAPKFSSPPTLLRVSSAPKAVPKAPSSKRLPNKRGPVEDAGGPHSSFRRDPSGRIAHYETYDWNQKTGKWGAAIRLRGSGDPTVVSRHHSFSNDVLEKGPVRLR